jgi:hypothetical protein
MLSCSFSFFPAPTFRIENFMSLIKIVIYTLAFLLSLLFLGRFFF